MKLRTSSIDKCIYNTFTLYNGLKILIITDPEADKAGCSLSVNVGSLDEPKEIEGLAHFLEHMLFMGTKEYPGENEYMDFLSQHNGQSNAYTANENTVYYFDVSLTHFEEALKRFSSFFKSPLFLEDSVSREISAVHSEFLMGLCSDNWRTDRVFQLCCNENLPKSQFNVGTKKTLERENIHKEVKSFWQHNYSPERMCLVLYSNLAVEDCKRYFKLFEGIPTGGKKGIQLEIDPFKLPCLFKENLKNKIIKIEPLKNQKTLVISIVLPSEYKLINILPYVYIGHLFSKEDEEGFVKLLKDKELGFYATFNVESISKYSLLKISIGLTNRGIESIKEVKRLIISYFKSISLKETEYLKLKELKELQFTFKEMEDPIDCVESLSELMQYVPLDNILDYSYSLNEWNEETLKKILSLISNPSNWLVFLLTKEGNFNLRDELYGINYEIVG